MFQSGGGARKKIVIFTAVSFKNINFRHCVSKALILSSCRLKTLISTNVSHCVTWSWLIFTIVLFVTDSVVWMFWLCFCVFWILRDSCHRVVCIVDPTIIRLIVVNSCGCEVWTCWFLFVDRCWFTQCMCDSDVWCCDSHNHLVWWCTQFADWQFVNNLLGDFVQG